MHARVITFRGAKNIDDGVTYIEEKVKPFIKEQKGYGGMTASADRAGNVFGILSLWETEADRKASEAALDSARQEGLSIIGGDMTVENFEETLVDLGAIPPGPGAALLVQRVSMDPSVLDDNLAFFKSEIAPRIKANPGFLAIRQMVNRTTGESILGTVWQNADNLQAAVSEAQARRSEGEARGVTFGEESRREILFVDMP